jgi:cytochrome c peroxidase
MAEPNLPTTLLHYANISYPNHVQQAIEALDNTPADNRITNEGATLGRVLFFDKKLSQNNRIACASCHRNRAGFSDRKPQSRGFERKRTRRNSMTLLNTRFYKSGKMFWDERATTLEEQVLIPIEDHIEMGMDLEELVPKLQAIDYYPALFEAAFGTTTVSKNTISKALAQYIRSMVTYESKYDKIQQGLAQFTEQELRGKQIFETRRGATQQSCNDCHGGGQEDRYSSHFQIGQKPMSVDPHDSNDLGIYEQTAMDRDKSKFKLGSLRNITQTAPYFHDGSAASLPEVLSSSGHDFGLSTTEIDDIVAYLETLTDYEIGRKEKYKNPFLRRK